MQTTLKKIEERFDELLISDDDRKMLISLIRQSIKDALESCELKKASLNLRPEDEFTKGYNLAISRCQSNIKKFLEE